jgi:hypothetical protein
MLTIDHEHIVLLIMLTMINFNYIALKGVLYLKNLIFYRHFFFVHCKAENLSTLQQYNSVRHVHRKQKQTGEPRA